VSEESEHPELLDWQRELLDQRIKDVEARPEDWVSWDEAKQRLARLPDVEPDDHDKL